MNSIELFSKKLNWCWGARKHCAFAFGADCCIDNDWKPQVVTCRYFNKDKKKSEDDKQLELYW